MWVSSGLWIFCTGRELEETWGKVKMDTACRSHIFDLDLFIVYFTWPLLILLVDHLKIFLQVKWCISSCFCVVHHLSSATLRPATWRQDCRSLCLNKEQFHHLAFNGTLLQWWNSLFGKLIMVWVIFFMWLLLAYGHWWKFTERTSLHWAELITPFNNTIQRVFAFPVKYIKTRQYRKRCDYEWDQHNHKKKIFLKKIR